MAMFAMISSVSQVHVRKSTGIHGGKKVAPSGEASFTEVAPDAQKLQQLTVSRRPVLGEGPGYGAW